MTEKFKGLTFLVIIALFTTGCLGGGASGGITKKDSYSVSGRVVDMVSGEGIAGVTLGFSGFGVAITDDDGHWSKDGLKGNVRIVADAGSGTHPAQITVSSTCRDLIFEAVPSDDYVVEFADPLLEWDIRIMIDKLSGGITYGDLKDIEEYEFRGGGDILAPEVGEQYQVYSLEGMEYMTSLRTVSFIGHQIVDLSPLKNLVNLEDITMEINQIESLAPLQNLTNVTRLSMTWNNISDISGIANMKKLVTLELPMNEITDISPIAGLSNLVDLRLGVNPGLQDVSVLATHSFPKLWRIALDETGVSDLSPLRNLTSLERIWVSDIPASDFTPIANLSRLTELAMSRTQVTDISFLTGPISTNLEQLVLSDNDIQDITPLAGLDKCVSVALDGTMVADISPLLSMDAVEWVNLRDTPNLQLKDLTSSERQIADVLEDKGVVVAYERY